MKKIAEHQDFLIGTLAYALFWMDESLQASLEAAGWAIIGIEDELGNRIGKAQLKQLKQALSKGWGPIVVVPPV